MKTLKINVPEGYEIDKEQSTFENIVFKEIKNELPKSWQDLENLKGFYVGINSDVVVTRDNVIKTKTNHFIFATKEQAEASIALAQLSQLREVYRQGWVPDWENGSITKYTIRGFRNDLIFMDGYEAEEFLSFQSKEIAEQFLENFRDLIEQAKPLMS
jgi:hypothetical protein